jgi:hypothetical protein
MRTPIDGILTATSRDGNAEIYVMKADGTGPVNPMNNPAEDWYPAWRP